MRTSSLDTRSTSLKIPPGFMWGPSPSHRAHTPPIVSRSFSASSSGLLTSTKSSFSAFAARMSVTSNSKAPKYP
jgi:hypothetical protein